SLFIRGVEGSVRWQPVNAWTLGLSGNIVHNEYYEINAFRSTHEVGDPSDMVPKYTFDAFVEYFFTMFGRKSSASLDYNQRGPSKDRDRSIGEWWHGSSDTINELGFNMDLRLNDNVSIELYGQNLLNDRGYTDPFTETGYASRNRPRTVGLQIGVSFQ